MCAYLVVVFFCRCWTWPPWHCWHISGCPNLCIDRVSWSRGASPNDATKEGKPWTCVKIMTLKLSKPCVGSLVRHSFLMKWGCIYQPAKNDARISAGLYLGPPRPWTRWWHVNSWSGVSMNPDGRYVLLGMGWIPCSGAYAYIYYICTLYTHMCACVRIDALMDGRMDDVWWCLDRDAHGKTCCSKKIPFVSPW